MENGWLEVDCGGAFALLIVYVTPFLEMVRLHGGLLLSISIGDCASIEVGAV